MTGNAVAPSKGAPLTFRSINGILYPAKLIGVHLSAGRCTIEVDVGAGDFFPLTMVKWSDHPTEETFVAWPKESKN